MVFSFNLIVLFFIISDDLLVFLMEPVKLEIEGLQRLLDLADLIVDSPGVLLIVVLARVVHMLAVRSFNNALMFVTMTMVSMIMIMSVYMATVFTMTISMRTQVNYCEWVVVQEDIDVHNDLSKIKQVISEKVQVNLTPS